MSNGRTQGHERLDESEDRRGYGGLASASYDAMNVSSRYMGTVRSIRGFIRRQLNEFTYKRPLRILDMGAGICDIAESVARWARHRSHEIEFTCVDINSHAINRARHRLAERPELKINIVHDSIEEHRPAQPYDCAIGSLFFHHFTDRQILELMEHLRHIVRRSVFINDLRRCAPAFIGFLALGPFMHPGVWHDGLMSIRRGFREEGLRDMLEHLPNVSITTRHELLFRVTATVRFLEMGRCGT